MTNMLIKVLFGFNIIIIDILKTDFRFFKTSAVLEELAENLLAVLCYVLCDVISDIQRVAISFDAGSKAKMSFRKIINNLSVSRIKTFFNGFKVFHWLFKAFIGLCTGINQIRITAINKIMKVYSIAFMILSNYNILKSVTFNMIFKPFLNRF